MEDQPRGQPQRNASLFHAQAKNIQAPHRMSWMCLLRMARSTCCGQSTAPNTGGGQAASAGGHHTDADRRRTACSFSNVSCGWTASNSPPQGTPSTSSKPQELERRQREQPECRAQRQQHAVRERHIRIAIARREVAADVQECDRLACAERRAEAARADRQPHVHAAQPDVGHYAQHLTLHSVVVL
eukprot:354041-Chlamydomonas_euryale.AAC.10